MKDALSGCGAGQRGAVGPALLQTLGRKASFGICASQRDAPARLLLLL